MYHGFCSESTTNRSRLLFPIYSNVTNQQINADDVFSLAEYNSTECPDGLVSNSTTDFRLFDDGSLSIGDQHKSKINEFCINEMASANAEDGSPVFVVRFCVPDLCVIGPCIRKCCPPDSVILDRPEMTPFCQPHPIIPFNVSQLTFQNSTSAFFSIHGGLGPKCYDKYELNSFNPVDPTKFFITAEGRFSTNYPSTPIDDQMTNKYCVDQSVNTTTLFQLHHSKSRVSLKGGLGLGLHEC